LTADTSNEQPQVPIKSTYIRLIKQSYFHGKDRGWDGLLDLEYWSHVVGAIKQSVTSYSVQKYAKSLEDLGKNCWDTNPKLQRLILDCKIFSRLGVDGDGATQLSLMATQGEIIRDALLYCVAQRTLQRWK
jgi:hypothetical protein